MVQNRDRAVARQDEVAVHAVHEEGGMGVGCGRVRNGELGGGEGLRDGGAAVDATCAGRVPQGAGVCEDVLFPQRKREVLVWAGRKGRAEGYEKGP